MTNTWYASDWDQAYRPSYAKIRCTVVRHIQVHLYHAMHASKQHFSIGTVGIKGLIKEEISEYYILVDDIWAARKTNDTLL